MLTFLSWSLRSMIDAALSRAVVPAPLLPSGAERPGLRIVGDGETPDLHVAVPAARSPAFVAGEGARIYSLEVFRRERQGGPSPRRVA